jgi:hypothetical protein
LKEIQMKLRIVAPSICLVALAVSLMAFSRGAGPPALQGPIALSQLTLNRAVRGVVPVFGSGNTFTFPTDNGVVITEIAMEPRQPATLNSQLDGLGVQFAINTGLKTTACFTPEELHTSPGARCNTKDRRVRFDPPLIVPPGSSITLTLLVQNQGSMLWGPAASNSWENFSLAGYLVFPGEV